MKKLAKKLSLITAILMVFQLASFGLGVGTQGALAAVDSVSPTLVMSPASSLGTTGEVTTIETTVYDDVLVASAEISFDGGTTFLSMTETTASITAADPSKKMYIYSKPVPNNSIASIIYQVRGSDSSGNVTTINDTITVSDNDAPTITQLNNETFKKGPNLPGERLVTGTDNVQIDNLCYELSSIKEGSILATCVAPVSVSRIAEWNVVDIFTNATGYTDLNSVPNDVYTINYRVLDAAGNQSIPDETIKYTIIDNPAGSPAAPTLNPVTSPTSLGTQKISGTKEVNTSVWLNGEEKVLLNDKTTWEYVMPLSEGSNPLSLTVKDETGNESSAVTSNIIKDSTAPSGVTGLRVVINSLGQPVVTWTNPPAGTYSGLKILRDGAFLATLDPSATSYTDSFVAQGVTYSYEVVSYDKAGNETGTTPVYVKVPMPPRALLASAGFSDSGDETAISQATTTTPSNTVKANENKTDDNKNKDDKNDLPLWGIVVLFILAIIGGYLVYTQRPRPVTRPTTPISPKSKAPRSTRKK